MDLEIGHRRDFLHVETGFRKAFQRFQRPPLQQFGQRPFQSDLEARMGTEAGEHTLVLRMDQGHVHDRIAAAERGVAHDDAEAFGAQSLDASGDAGIPRDHLVRHFWQAQAFGDDAVLDGALEDLRQRLAARFHHGVPGGHAVAHIEVADDVDRYPGLRAITQPRVRQSADAAFDIAGIEVDQHTAVDFTIRVIEGMQLGVEQFGRPCTIGRMGEPAFLRIMHERPVGAGLAEIEMGPEVMRAEPLEKFAQRTGARRQCGCTLAVCKQHRAVMVLHMTGPDRFDRIEPGGFVEMEAARRQLGLHGADGGFERGVLAGDEAFCLHDVYLKIECGVDRVGTAMAGAQSYISIWRRRSSSSSRASAISWMTAPTSATCVGAATIPVSGDSGVRRPA